MDLPVDGIDGDGAIFDRDFAGVGGCVGCFLDFEGLALLGGDPGCLVGWHRGGVFRGGGCY